MDFDKILQETLEIQRQANLAWASGKKDLLDDAGLTMTVLGCGTMGIAILGGIMDALKNPTSSPGDEPTPEKLPTKFRACFRSRRSGLRVQEELGRYNAKLTMFERNNLKAIQGSDIVLLACTSNELVNVLCEDGIREALADKLLISIVAGVTVKDIGEVLYPKNFDLSKRCTIVRAMPNTAAAVRESMTVIAISNSPLHAKTEALITWIFTRIGRIVRLPETKMDVASALCGSGPAFAALMAESLAAGAIAMGCPQEEAYTMAAQTMRGTTGLLLKGEHPAILRDKVSTPDGCTYGGLQVLEEGAARGMIARAVRESTAMAVRIGSNVRGKVVWLHGRTGY